jgi:hypothetical protein
MSVTSTEVTELSRGEKNGQQRPGGQQRRQVGYHGAAGMTDIWTSWGMVV